MTDSPRFCSGDTQKGNQGLTKSQSKRKTPVECWDICTCMYYIYICKTATVSPRWQDAGDLIYTSVLILRLGPLLLPLRLRLLVGTPRSRLDHRAVDVALLPSLVASFRLFVVKKKLVNHGSLLGGGGKERENEKEKKNTAQKMHLCNADLLTNWPQMLTGCTLPLLFPLPPPCG